MIQEMIIYEIKKTPLGYLPQRGGKWGEEEEENGNQKDCTN